ncbi:uncharacterized protein ACIGJ3_017049 [Trichechus inunguis]
MSRPSLEEDHLKPGNRFGVGTLSEASWGAVSNGPSPDFKSPQRPDDPPLDVVARSLASRIPGRDQEKSEETLQRRDPGSKGCALCSWLFFLGGGCLQTRCEFFLEQGGHPWAVERPVRRTLHLSKIRIQRQWIRSGHSKSHGPGIGDIQRCDRRVFSGRMEVLGTCPEGLVQGCDFGELQ